MKQTCDVLVIGAGVVGVSLALELKRRQPQREIIVVDKENNAGFHASGRNSGVLHAGFYYSADSLKARFCREGNTFWHRYCRERGLSLRACGKVVVARDAADLPALNELHRRGTHNGVPLELRDAKDLHELEPRALSHQQFLWSPTTSSIVPTEVLNALVKDAMDLGVQFIFNCPWKNFPDKNQALCGHQIFKYDYLVNCAGVHADTVAKNMGFCQHYVMLPFKGVYLMCDEEPTSMKCHIYPVPDLRFPFLGVHTTLSADGHAKIGPTAIPAFWREHYQGLEGFNGRECLEILCREAGLFFKAGFDFRGLAFNEIKKYYKPYLLKQASQLCTGLDAKQWIHWGRPGIRAQLLNTQTRKLEMDFLMEGDEHSFHVLNAVSPALTCANPFASYCADRIDEYRSG